MFFEGRKNQDSTVRRLSLEDGDCPMTEIHGRPSKQPKIVYFNRIRVLMCLPTITMVYCTTIIKGELASSIAKAIFYDNFSTS